MAKFNEVSEKLLADIPTLNPGELKTFQCLWGIKVHEADNESKYEMAYGKRRFMCYDKIYDPYLKTTVDIGIAEQMEGDKPKTYKVFAPGETDMKFGGRFSLSGDNIEDIELFKFFMLWNKTKGNKHRSANVEPLIELLSTDAPKVSIPAKPFVVKSAEVKKEPTTT